MTANLADGKPRRDSGMILLVVLVILLAITASSSSFIWMMNQQQTRAGARFRTAAAMALAEAGVHRALSVFESVAPDGTPGRAWRPAAYSETVTVGHLLGQFTLSVTDEPGGAILVTSAGEVAGTTRGLRARVYFTSPALLAGLYGAGHVRLERPPAALVIATYGTHSMSRPWVHIAAGRGVGFATSGVSINDPPLGFETYPGPIALPTSPDGATILDRGPARLLLAREAEVMVAPNNARVDIQQLRAMGLAVDGTVLRAEVFPKPPEVDRDFFQAQARANTSNAALNEAAGRHFRDEDLARKPDSLYSRQQFERLLTYMRSLSQPAVMQGAIYVTGRLTVPARQHVKIVDGALVADDRVHLSQGATLEVQHTASTRTLPGIIVLRRGSLLVAQDARLRVHGLVYVSGGIDVWQRTRVDVVGAVLSPSRRISFRSLGGTVVIRYDPAVLGTPGLRVPAGEPVVAWAAIWEELP